MAQFLGWVPPLGGGVWGVLRQAGRVVRGDPLPSPGVSKRNPHRTQVLQTRVFVASETAARPRCPTYARLPKKRAITLSHFLPRLELYGGRFDLEKVMPAVLPAWMAPLLTPVSAGFQLQATCG